MKNTAARESGLRPESERFHPLRFTLSFVGSVLALLALLAAANHALNPLVFSRGALRDVAAALVQGKHVAVYDPNLDFRGLRREHIRLMPEAPDVAIFAGSRFEVATRNTFPGRSFYNAFGHNDYFEDLFAFVGLLEEANRLPKTLVMSVRYITFEPIARRETEEWKMFAPEYQRMAERLGVPVAPFRMTFPRDHYASLLSLDVAKHGLVQSFKKTSAPFGATDKESLPDMDVIHPDGSMSFSAAHAGTFTAESARKESLGRAEKLKKKSATQPTDDDKAALGKLLDHLRSKGVQAVIAITPHHPAFWQAIAHENYGKALSQLEQTVRQLAALHDAAFVGSFDPKAAGCQERSFRDYIHLDEACLKSIFDQIPPITADKTAIKP
ncbi:SGNH/GDSL hydrolase family protein [Pendulispora albinea]|uniref:SGNH/GDSL hydrolase family protein n=1 Tax=Pendulispora albinea TaxID=2741071 RepID=A0ABZ2MAD9_9BACT